MHEYFILCFASRSLIYFRPSESSKCMVNLLSNYTWVDTEIENITSLGGGAGAATDTGGECGAGAGGTKPEVARGRSG